MSVYRFIEIFVLSHCGIVALLILFFLYFDLKYKRIAKANYYIGKKLDIVRGKFTVLYLLKIFSFIFIISWIVLALPWIDIFIGTNFIASYQDGYLRSYFGVFVIDENNSYLMIVLLTIIIGLNSFSVIKRIKNILCDESLFIGNDTRLRCRKRVF
ncbi:MAG: hypothetical protein JJE53_01755 [Candidatus Pacebacteria bacterium]|nr:hypothetical protein [Candidatus Paceibacterota bacterium]